MTAQPMDPKDVPAECDGADDPRERCGHHHTTSLGNAMGGYNCCCGWAWLPRVNECSTGAKTGDPVPPGDYVCDLLAYVAATSGESDYEAQAAAAIPLIRAQVADEITAHFTQERAQVADAEPVTLGGVHEQAKLLGRYDRVIATIDRIARGDQ